MGTSRNDVYAAGLKIGELLAGQPHVMEVCAILRALEDGMPAERDVQIIRHALEDFADRVATWEQNHPGEPPFTEADVEAIIDQFPGGAS